MQNWNEEVKVELKADVKSLSTDPYASVIKARHSYFVDWKTVGFIPREISGDVYFFIKEEHGKVFGTLKLLKYEASSTPFEGLEVPLPLTFSRKEKWVADTMEKFIQNFYTFEYSGNQSVDTRDSEDEEKDEH